MRDITDEKRTSFETAQAMVKQGWIIDKWYEKLIMLGLIAWAVFSFGRWWLF